MRSKDCEKRVVLAGQRDKTSIFESSIIFCYSWNVPKERKKRERGQRLVLFFLPLNTFQLLFDLDRDILSYSLTWPLRHVSFHITWNIKQKNNHNCHETLKKVLELYRTVINLQRAPWSIESTGTRWSRNKSLNYYSLLIFIVYLNLLHDF